MGTILGQFPCQCRTIEHCSSGPQLGRNWTLLALETQDQCHLGQLQYCSVTTAFWRSAGGLSSIWLSQTHPCLFNRRCAVTAKERCEENLSGTAWKAEVYKDAENSLEVMSRLNEMHLSRSAIRISGKAQHRCVWGHHSSILDFRGWGGVEVVGHSWCYHSGYSIRAGFSSSPSSRASAFESVFKRGTGFDRFIVMCHEWDSDEAWLRHRIVGEV